MMTFALALFLTAPLETPARMVVGSEKVGGQAIPVDFPMCGLEPPKGPAIVDGGLTYPIFANGSLGNGQVADGGWGEFAAAYKQSILRSEPSLTWKEKVFVVNRVELAETLENGDVRLRRGAIDSFQIPEIKAAVARFEAMVRGTTRGAVQIETQFEEDSDPERQMITASHTTAIDQQFIDRVIGARINQQNFSVDDGVDRGPYHGVMVIHCGRVDPAPLTSTHDTPVSTISYYTRSVLSDPDRLALSLYASWIRQVSWRMARAGYRLPVFSQPFDNPFLFKIGSFVSNQQWPSLMQAKPTPGEDWTSRQFPASISAKPWNEVEDDPWTKLPIRDSRDFDFVTDLPRRLQAAQFEVQLVDRGETTYVFAPTSHAAIIGHRAHSSYGLVAIGTLREGAFPVIVFRTQRTVPLDREANLFVDPRDALAAIGNSKGIVPVKDGFAFVGDPDPEVPAPSQPISAFKNTLKTVGTMRAEIISDPEQGPCSEITERGFYRTGSAQLLSVETGAVDLAKSPAIHFSFRQTSRDPYALRIEFANGGIGFINFDANPMVPVGAIDQRSPSIDAPLEALNLWQRVHVDLSKLFSAVGSTLVRSISLTPSPYAEYYERTQIEAGTFTISAIKFDNDLENLTKPGVPISADLETKLAIARKIVEPVTDEQIDLLRGLLSEGNRRAQLTATSILEKFKVPALSQALIDVSKNGNVWVATSAMRALRNQDTPAAWTAIRRGLEIGPYDHNREAAAEAVAQKTDPSFVGSLSLLYAAKSWRAREAAVRALSAIKTRDSSIVAATFLKESEPNVRLTCVETADMTFDLVARRVLYAAVNDASESVRASAAVRLLDCPIAELRKEALRSIRDDSPFVRKAILQALAEKPRPETIAAIRSVLRDQDPSVRSAAVLARFAAEPDIDSKDLELLIQETDPRVLETIGTAFKAKKIAIPGELMKTMSSSPDPKVKFFVEPRP